MSCVKSVSNQDFSVAVQMPVSPVLSPVRSILSVQTLSQKKDLSPLSKTKRDIKKCFNCRSLCFWPKCIQCPQCCTCSAGGRSSAKLLVDMVPPRPKSKGSVDLEGRIHSPLQTQASSGKGPVESQWICKPPKEPLPEGGFACTDSHKGSR